MLPRESPPKVVSCKDHACICCEEVATVTIEVHCGVHSYNFPHYWSYVRGTTGAGTFQGASNHAAELSVSYLFVVLEKLLDKTVELIWYAKTVVALSAFVGTYLGSGFHYNHTQCHEYDGAQSCGLDLRDGEDLATQIEEYSTQLYSAKAHEIIQQHGLTHPDQVPAVYLVTIWRHDTLSAVLALYEGNPPAPGGFPHKAQLCGALLCSVFLFK